MLRYGLGWTFLAAILALGGVGSALGDQTFLKIDTIEGEATRTGYEKQIEIQSWSWGVTNTTAATKTVTGGATAGRANITDLNLMKVTDAATPKLFQAAAGGKHFPKAVLTVLRESSGTWFPYLKINLEDVMVSGLQLSAGGERPSESLSLSFGKVVMEYRTTDASGKPTNWVPAGWNLKENVPAQ